MSLDAVRSLLFAPATRPETVAKLPRTAPDAVAIDLEDAVPDADKERAREQARAGAAALLELPRADRPAVLIRVNAPDSRWIEGDLEQALPPGLDGIVVPKLERPEQLARLRAALDARGLDRLGVVAGIETARGVLEVERLLGDPVDIAYFGAEDYIADLGGRRTPGGDEVLYARSRVALAARVHGVASLDQVVVTLRDEDAFLADATLGRAIGYRGKLCIHPDQVVLANRVFSPSAEELERSRQLIAAWERGAREGTGAVEFDGRMIDEPALKEARAMLARA